jgi:hypothetical protein
VRRDSTPVGPLYSTPHAQPSHAGARRSEEDQRP